MLCPRQARLEVVLLSIRRAWKTSWQLFGFGANRYKQRACYGSPYAIGPLSVLSLTLVYCGQTAGWIKVPLGTEVGFGPGDIVLDGEPAPPRKERGTAAPSQTRLGPLCFGTLAHFSNC